MIATIMRPEMIYAYPFWTVCLIMIGGVICATVLLAAAVQTFVGVETRRRHNDLTASILSVVGTTYAVLLAFVAMLAWQNYDAAKIATFREASRLSDVARQAAGLADPMRSSLRADLITYARVVRDEEWPAQAAGHASPAGEHALDDADAVVTSIQPTDIGQGNIQAALITALGRLRDARDERLASVEAAIPTIVWSVVIVGGAISLAFASLLGAQNVRMHIVLSVLLSLSGMLIFLMIVALNHPFRGDFRVTAKPFETFIAEHGP